MQEVVNDGNQARLVSELNRRFGSIHTDADGRKYRFATAIVLTFNNETKSLVVCNAGHPPPLWYRAVDNQWETLDSDKGKSGNNLPVGILESVAYRQFGVRLSKGDLVLCYTDSLIDSLDMTGLSLEVRGLMDLVRVIHRDASAHLVDELLASVDSMDPRNLIRDDVTCLLLQVN